MAPTKTYDGFVAKRPCRIGTWYAKRADLMLLRAVKQAVHQRPTRLLQNTFLPSAGKISHLD